MTLRENVSGTDTRERASHARWITIFCSFMLAFLPVMMSAQTEVRLKDGSVIRGKVQENSESTLVIRTPGEEKGRYKDVELERSNILSVHDLVRDRDITEKYLGRLGTLGPEEPTRDTVRYTTAIDAGFRISTSDATDVFDYIPTGPHIRLLCVFTPLRRDRSHVTLASIETEPKSFLEASVSATLPETITQYAIDLTGSVLVTPSVGIGGRFLSSELQVNAGNSRPVLNALLAGPAFAIHPSSALRLCGSWAIGRATRKSEQSWYRFDENAMVSMFEYRLSYAPDPSFGYSLTIVKWDVSGMMTGYGAQSYRDLDIDNTLEFPVGERSSLGIKARWTTFVMSDIRDGWILSIGPEVLAYQSRSVLLRFSATYDRFKSWSEHMSSGVSFDVTAQFRM